MLQELSQQAYFLAKPFTGSVASASNRSLNRRQCCSDDAPR
jgi:hypothetical protein